MPRYLYTFIEILGVMGDGTPECPGGDFDLSVWIDADDVEQARRWGKRVLEEFVKERFRHSKPNVDPSGYRGEIEEDVEILELSMECDIPVVKVGEIPQWTEPWKHDGASGPPRLSNI